MDIHRINHYPVDSMVCFVNTYPLDSDLSGGWRYPAFEQPGPDRHKTNHNSDTENVVRERRGEGGGREEVIN